MFVLISLTCVSATDNQTDEITTLENDMIADEILTDETVGNFTELQFKIRDYQETQDTFELTKNFTYNCEIDGPYQNGIEITKDNFTIDGKGYTINGANQARIFNITAKNVTLKNINFINGNSSYGGAVCFSDSGVVENCNFVNNSAFSEGGAIRFVNMGLVSGCNFTDNSASRFSAILFMSNGTVTNCNFTDNKANDGGAIRFNDTGTLINSTFINNKGTSYVGAVFIVNGNVINCSFVNNSAYSNGGAIRMVSGNVINCYFADNSVFYFGAAVYIGNGTVVNCNFTNNKATRDGSDGGAIHCNGEAYVAYCNFINNTVSRDGGAIWMNSGRVEICNFTNNNASNGGAILSNQNLGVTVDTCIFKTSSDTTFNTRNLPPTLDVNNFISIYNSGEKLTFNLKTNSGIPVTNGNILISVYLKYTNSWVGNYSCLSGEGWIVDLPAGNYYAIFNTEYTEFNPVNRTITIIPTSFFGLNYTINSNQDSVINLNNDFYFDLRFDADFVDGVEINRQVTINGNGYTIDANGKSRIFLVTSRNVVFENITFKNGYHADSGGAVYFNYNGKVINSNFINNNATRIGGGAVYFNSNGEMTNCNFTNNSASSYGGAVYISSGTLLNCNFIGNNANDGGGAIRMGSGTVSNCIFTDNKANGSYKDGGAIYFSDSGKLVNCNFTDNTASASGGAVNFNKNGEITNCNFINNTAFEWGGAVIFKINGEVTNCTFTDNKATEGSNYGGAVYFSDSGTVINSNFTDNTANTDGGAVYFGSSSNLTNCNFINNTATNRGGAVYFVEGNVTNCNFVENSATDDESYGGAVYFNRKGKVVNSNFVNNTASRGGAISSIISGGVTVDTCIFKTPSDTTYNTHNLPPTLDVDNFTAVHNSGEKLTLDLKTNSSIPVNNGNIFISVYNKNNNSWFANYTCLSGEGWIVDLPVGYYYAIFNTEYTEFNPVKRTITIIPETTFLALNYTLNSYRLITLNNDYYFDLEFDADFIDGIVINRPIKIIGNGHTINADGKARIFLVTSRDAVFENITFKNAHHLMDSGGAIYFNQTGNLTNCNFVNNSASAEGGAVFFSNGGNVRDCNFTGNDAKSGGAISTSDDLSISNSNFKDNTATDGSNNIILNGDARLILNNVTPEDLGPIYKGNMEIINVTNITYGDTAKITVKVTDAKNNPVNNGTVSVTIKGKEYSADVVNATATITIPDLDQGTYNVNITYQGKYAVLAKNTTFNVFKANSSVIINPIADVVYGNTTFITFDVDNRTEVDVIVYDEMGLIVFEKHNYTESNVTVPILPVGRYNVTITNNEAENYLGCVNSTVFHVIKANNTVKVEVNDVVYGTDVVVNVIAGVDGEYLINVNGTVKKVNVINGTGNVAFTLGAGSYWANATFDNGNYSSNITNATFIVFKANSSVIINPIADVVYGNTTFITFDVNNTTEVDVIVYDEMGLIVFEKYNYNESNVTVPILPVGRYNVTITNNETENYRGCVNSTVFHVIKANNTVKVEVNDVVYGTDVVVNVIAGVDGEYLINVNGTVKKVNVINGKGNVTFTLGAGSYWANATFNDGNYSSKITNATFNVFKANSSVIINPIEDLVYGNTTSVTFKVENITEVEVIVYDERGTIVFKKLIYRESPVTVPILPAGRYNVTITNKENKNYLSCVNSTVFHVIKANNTVKVEVNDVIYGAGVVVNVIAGVDGEYLINVNGTVKKVNVINGTGNVAFTLGGGCYWANATFDNGNYSSNITNATFNVFKANTLITAINKAYVINYDGKYSVTLKDAEGRLISGQKVTFILNGKNIGDAVSGVDGVATITLTAKILKAAKAGSKNLVVKFSGTQNYNPVSKSVKITVNKEKTKITAKKKTFKKSKKVKKYTITLKNSKGKAVKKVKVTLKIKGKTYKAKTNTKGKATFKIKKLIKKGIFKAKINFKATSLYLKSAKKVKIRIK